MIAFGAFGKMPVLGDFFRTGLGNGFVSGWDDWMQLRMSEASETLGERWDECYMSAPIWRFSLAAGLVGEDAVIGVLMPSVDRVGRKFPLTLAATRDEPENALVGHFASGQVFETLEGLALDALDDAMTLDLLKERLAQIELSEKPVSSTRSGTVARVQGEGTLDAALAALNVAPVREGASIWTAHIDGDARLAVCDGLPGASRMIDLLDTDAEIWRGDAA